jgi:hypothetical protein
LEKFNRSDIRQMCKYYDLFSWMSPKERLIQKLKDILKDDEILRRDGLDLLSDAEIEEALLDRGFLNLHINPSINRQWLKNWTQTSSLEMPLFMPLLYRLLHKCT